MMVIYERYAINIQVYIHCDWIIPINNTLGKWGNPFLGLKYILKIKFLDVE